LTVPLAIHLLHLILLGIQEIAFNPLIPDENHAPRAVDIDSDNQGN
jgi:hypothetical protein